MNLELSNTQARRLWMRAQGLDRRAPFGAGAAATPLAVEQLGYVQIDTISVIERGHHHILFTRIPDYKREHLHRSQTIDKTVFEYWTHALSYVPTKDFRFFARDMKRVQKSPGPWFASVKPDDLRKVLRRIRREGALSIRDIRDDVLVEKDHEWASRKPSKKALQLGFRAGLLAISERQGMLKKYELTDRHFNWQEKPRTASVTEILDYLIDRALRSQSFVSLDSICHLNASKKAAVALRLAARVKRGGLLPVSLPNDATPYWMTPEHADTAPLDESGLVHVLSPFDPLIIQRKRLKAVFNYDHIFEAYIPKEKRIFGYFALPVLIGDKIVATLDLKTDRQAGRLQIQKWKWLPKQKSSGRKRMIEEELHRFERFQLDL